MDATRQLVQRIRDAVASDGVLEQDVLAETVWDYAQACRRVNAKAEECLDLLRRGRRADAARLAKNPPDLQNEILRLNFEERPAWLDLCERSGMPVEEPLNIPRLLMIAQEIYAEEGTLDDLLRMHRRMALGGAPLLDRVRILRRIRAADPTHDFWDDDLRAWEKVAIQEIDRQARRAAREGDAGAMERLLAYLERSEWLSPPPKSLLEEIRRHLVPHRRKRVQARYGELADELHEALGARDRERAEALVAEWTALREETGFDPPPDLLDQVEPVREWLAEREADDRADAAYARACAALEAALGKTTDRHRLERLASKVLAFDRGMPEVLTARYHNRLRELRERRARRFRLAMAGIVGTVLLAAAGGVSFYVVHRAEARAASYEAKAASAVDAVAAALRDHRLAPSDIEQAREALASIPEDYANTVAVHAHAARLADLASRARTRGEAFDRAIDQLDRRIASIERAMAVPAEGEAMATLREWARRANAHGPTLERLAAEAGTLAVKTALSGNDVERAERAAERSRALHDRLAAELNQRFSGILPRLRRQVDDFKETSNAALAALRSDYTGYVSTDEEKVTADLDTATEVRGEAESLAGGLDAVLRTATPPEEVRSELTTLRETLDDRRGALAEAGSRLRRIGTDLRRLRTATRRLDMLADGLSDFANRHPRHPLARSFLIAARMKPHWEAIEAWQGVVAGWDGEVLVSDGTTARARLAQIQGYTAQHPHPPHRETIDRLAEYYTTAAENLDGGRLQQVPDTLELLNEPVIGDLYLVRAGDGRTLYIKSRHDVSETRTNGRLVGYQVRHIVDGAQTTESSFIRAADVAAEPEAAPQSVFAREAIDRLLDPREHRWETLYLDLVRLAFEQKGMDPILRATLLKLNLLPAARETTPFHADKLQPMATVLDGLNVVDVAWMDPENADARRLRQRIRRLVASTNTVDETLAAVRQTLGRLRESGRIMRPVGLVLGAGGEPYLRPGTPDATLYVLVGRPGGPATWHKVGRAAGGAFKAEGNVHESVPQGTPIFAAQPP